jgi:hypothetical protein
MTGAIAQDRESCQFLFCLTKIPPLYRSARPESGWEGRLWSCSLEVRASSSGGCVGRLVFGCQIVWNRSTRRAGERGGARVGSPKWLRILTITGGSSMAAMIFKAPPQLGQCSGFWPYVMECSSGAGVGQFGAGLRRAR